MYPAGGRSPPVPVGEIPLAGFEYNWVWLGEGVDVVLTEVEVPNPDTGPVPPDTGPVPLTKGLVPLDPAIALEVMDREDESDKVVVVEHEVVVTEPKLSTSKVELADVETSEDDLTSVVFSDESVPDVVVMYNRDVELCTEGDVNVIVPLLGPDGALYAGVSGRAWDDDNESGEVVAVEEEVRVPDVPEPDPGIAVGVRLE